MAAVDLGDDFAADDEEFEMEEDAALETEEAVAAAAAAAGDESQNILYKYHPEAILRYAETIDPLVPLRVAPPAIAQAANTLVDEKHTTPPFLTVYERTKILGTRTSQLADGAKPFIDPNSIPEHITQPLEIAKLELERRVLPFIIERPMPDGTFEYWRLSDLMII